MRSTFLGTGRFWILAASGAAALLFAGCGGGLQAGSVISAETSALCGNGVRDPGEQCDDGNTSNLDGCSSTCQFEQAQRINALQMQYGTDSYCSVNALGGAIASVAQSKVQDAITTNVGSGAITVLFDFIGLSDLNGANDASFNVGSVTGTPAAGAGYNGASDLDWWYTADTASLDASRNPTALLSASMTGQALTAGPGNVNLKLDLGGGPATLSMTKVTAQASVGGTSAPTASQGTTPGHLASENLDPALVSFASMANGALCGNISAASLANLPVPAEVRSGGSSACREGYTDQNSMLDVLIGGCHILFFNAINVTQPDQINAAVPAAGAGAPYALSEGSDHKVNGCTDSSGNSVDLATCLAAAAYSSSFHFATDRVIIK